MVLGELYSLLPWVQTVQQFLPDELLQFNSEPGKTAKSVSIKSLIDKYAPEFQHNSKCVIPPFLCSGHMQTIFASMFTFESKHLVYYKRYILNYPDGGEGALDVCVPQSLWKETGYVPKNQRNQLLPRYTYFDADEKFGSSDTKPMLIILHGLTGGSNESYVRSLVDTITNEYNFEACVLNSRGCCQSSITTPFLYCGLWTDDVRFCVKELRNKFPNRKFFLCGVSLGASMTANYLGQESDQSDVELGVVLGNPWDLTASSYHLERNLIGKYAYTPALAKNLVKLTTSHLDVLKQNPEMARMYADHLHEVKTVEEFDNFFTARMFGFNTSFEYYRHGTSSNRLNKLRTPLLILNALDDPIVGCEALPYREVQSNPYTLMLTTTRGGHIGWFDMNLDRWYVKPLCRLLHKFYTDISMQGLAPDLKSVDLPKENKFKNDRIIR
ncbi:putative carboxylic ester hydrolase [Kluyveromyces lactis]|uniref:KLLA0D06039p n=1 Tax=Kluyveromyces lactis (strain ATCC 8585 / CBS 2359 / DSM 70799 / NBRC 1267 / NRRL Y-1140 / WM37) TaxID=284590 RepID=Q6CRV8_KLULA|nr:uncharacterized protein KLLA0_D06039g [Kluyveromyces lactis]CAH00427.1 KLLA0D06039p [Kluyveromyces lactis]|eukprot:XP_453331.1 uncharacterized protein KLLA0_D06039g [Kluyveromyces lactis]